MKRKIFTTLAAAGILACSIATASATSVPQCVQKPICFYWQNPCYEIQLPNQCPILPELPDLEDSTPIVPELPDTEDSTPIVPDTPDTEDSTPIVPEAPEQDNTGVMSQLEQEACRLVNQFRQENGLAPLTIDSNLSIKARIKSEDMKVNNYFSHNSPTYGTPFQMMQSLGISYRTAGENIAMGYTTAEAVVNAWMNSDGHRANILSSNYTSMGIGFVDGYWTQWFIG